LARVLGCSKVACLIRSDDSIAADARALTDRVHEAAQRKFVVRSGGVTLSLENCNLIHPAHRQAKLSRMRGIQSDATGKFGMQTAQIHSELTVDEYPNVIVSGEIQRLTPGERERVPKFAGKRVIVACALSAPSWLPRRACAGSGEGSSAHRCTLPTLIVDREEATQSLVGCVIRTIKNVGAVRLTYER